VPLTLSGCVAPLVGTPSQVIDQYVKSKAKTGYVSVEVTGVVQYVVESDETKDYVVISDTGSEDDPTHVDVVPSLLKSIKGLMPGEKVHCRGILDISEQYESNTTWERWDYMTIRNSKVIRS